MPDIKSLKFPGALRRATGWVGLLPIAEYLAERFRPKQLLEIGPLGSNFSQSMKQSLMSLRVIYKITFLDPVNADAEEREKIFGDGNRERFEVIHLGEEEACALVMGPNHGLTTLLGLLRPGGILLVDAPASGTYAEQIVDELASMGPVWRFDLDMGLALAVPKGEMEQETLQTLEEKFATLLDKGQHVHDELERLILAGELVRARLNTSEDEDEHLWTSLFVDVLTTQISFYLRQSALTSRLVFVPGIAPLRVKLKKVQVENEAGERLQTVCVSHTADTEREGVYLFASKTPKFSLVAKNLEKLVRVVVQLEYESAGVVASKAMIKDMIDEVRAGHWIIDSKEEDLANTKEKLAAIEGSLTWRLARIVLGPLDYLLGKETMANLSTLMRSKKLPTAAIEFDREYKRWVKQCDTLKDDERREMRKNMAAMAKPPVFSVILPTYNTDKKWLIRCIESVRQQIYPHWELCIADDASSKSHVRRILEDYAQKDSRIKVVFREENGHICAASNSALDLATGDYVALLDHDDELSEHALYTLAQAVVDNADLDIVYTDEDKVDARGRRFAPHFKPDWNPDMLLSQNYICHLMAIRRSLVEDLGGLREGYEGSQDYDLVLRASRATTPERIRHIPKICYHWRAVEGSTALSLDFKSYCTPASRQAVTDHLEALDIPAKAVPGSPSCIHRVVFFRSEDPLVSIIIPTKNQCEILEPLVGDILNKTTYRNLELIVVDHESDEEDSRLYLEKLEREPLVKVLSFKGPFNYSAINNYATTKAKGDILAFLNNDLRVITPGWLGEMAGHALRPEIGAVGAKLYYPDNTIQHAGLILGIKDGIAESQFQGLDRDVIGFGGRTHILQDISAVTAACMVLRREIFEKAGGFDEDNLPVAFNDVNLCLMLMEMGYRNLFTPFAQFYHLESASRGSDQTEATRKRFAGEVKYMKDRWGEALKADPYYNPNLSLEGTDFSLSWT